MIDFCETRGISTVFYNVTVTWKLCVPKSENYIRNISIRSKVRTKVRNASHRDPVTLIRTSIAERLCLIITRVYPQLDSSPFHDPVLFERKLRVARFERNVNHVFGFLIDRGVSRSDHPIPQPPFVSSFVLKRNLL